MPPRLLMDGVCWGQHAAVYHACLEVDAQSFQAVQELHLTCAVPEIQEVQKPVHYDREVLKEEIQEVYVDKVVERVVEVLKEVYVDKPVQRRVEVTSHVHASWPHRIARLYTTCVTHLIPYSQLANAHCVAGAEGGPDDPIRRSRRHARGACGASRGARGRGSQGGADRGRQGSSGLRPVSQVKSGPRESTPVRYTVVDTLKIPLQDHLSNAF